MSTKVSKDLPLVSFVIPCFNSVKYLARSLDSIVKERREFYPSLEIIVIDGGSTDGTVEVIRRYEKELAYWLSEPDQGPADAFNKGWRKARGEYIRYMAADDEIIPGHTHQLVEAIQKDQRLAVTGGTFADSGDGGIGGAPAKRPNQATGNIRRYRLMLWDTLPGFCPEACLFKRKVLADLGGWPLRFRYACDLEFWFNVIDAGYQIFILPDTVLRKHVQDGAVTVRFSERVGRDTQLLLKERAGPGFALVYKARYNLAVRRAAEAPFKALGLHPLRAFRRVRGWFSANE